MSLNYCLLHGLLRLHFEIYQLHNQKISRIPTALKLVSKYLWLYSALTEVFDNHLLEKDDLVQYHVQTAFELCIVWVRNLVVYKQRSYRFVSIAISSSLSDIITVEKNLTNFAIAFCRTKKIMIDGNTGYSRGHDNLRHIYIYKYPRIW